MEGFVILGVGIFVGSLFSNLVRYLHMVGTLEIDDSRNDQIPVNARINLDKIGNKKYILLDVVYTKLNIDSEE